MMAQNFPDGFTWGVSASAPQTEGQDGRGASIWDRFAAMRGSIQDGSDMKVGTGFETLYATDIGLVADAGVRAFRFSIAWPRVQPSGKGSPSPEGLAVYDRIVDAMLARGLEPWPTLFHWDMPAALPGDWRNRDTIFRFADYAQIVAARLGDRVRHWIVLNEPSSVAVFGYAFGRHPPLFEDQQAYLAAVHHQNLAQGLAVQALRSVLPPDRRIGTSLNVQLSLPADGLPEHEEAALIIDDAFNRVFLDPLFGRPYPVRFAQAVAPLVKPGDLATIAAGLDFLGINYYAPFYARTAPGSALGATLSDPPAGIAVTDGGFGIEPDGFAATLLMLKRDYGDPTLVVTEMGAAFDDPRPHDGQVDDPRRIEFIRRYLAAAIEAIRQGVKLDGLFYWTATDNWEWRAGFTAGFGLIQVDRTTLARTPKRSLGYFGRCALGNAVADA